MASVLSKYHKAGGPVINNTPIPPSNEPKAPAKADKK